MIEKEFNTELFGKYRVKGIARIEEVEVPTCTHSRALDPCYETRRTLKDIEFDKIIDLDTEKEIPAEEWDDIYSKLARAVEEEIKAEL